MTDRQDNAEQPKDRRPDNFFTRMSTARMVITGAVGASLLAGGSVAMAAGAPFIAAAAPLVVGGFAWSISVQSAAQKAKEFMLLARENEQMRDKLRQADGQDFEKTADPSEVSISKLTQAVEYLSGVRDRLQSEHSLLLSEKNNVEQQLQQSKENERSLAAQVASLQAQIDDRGAMPQAPQQQQDVNSAAKMSRGGLTP